MQRQTKPKLGILVKIDERPLRLLTELAEDTRVPRAVYIREAIDDLLKKHASKLRKESKR